MDKTILTGAAAIVVIFYLIQRTMFWESEEIKENVLKKMLALLKKIAEYVITENGMIRKKPEGKTTMKATVFAIILAGAGVSAFAQEAQIENAALPTVQTDAAPVVSQTLLQNFVKVCKGGYVLSDKAMAACAANVTPKTNKTGDAFRNTGIGIEFNTLIRNMK